MKGRAFEVCARPGAVKSARPGGLRARRAGLVPSRPARLPDALAGSVSLSAGLAGAFLHAGRMPGGRAAVIGKGAACVPLIRPCLSRARARLLMQQAPARAASAMELKIEDARAVACVLGAPLPRAGEGGVVKYSLTTDGREIAP